VCGAAERADDREVEVTVPEARVAPVEEGGETAARGVVEQVRGFDVRVQQHRRARSRLGPLELAALACEGVEHGGKL
jgi:hypothetical protein